MKVSELMIGDLVNLGYRDLTLKIIGLDVRKNSILVEAQDNFKLQIAYDEEEIKPIPLTEEILKANGFRAVEDYGMPYADGEPAPLIGMLWYYNNDFYPLELNSFEGNYSINNEPIWFKVLNRLRIRYVHELQHALRLCGLDELADNLKI